MIANVSCKLKATVSVLVLVACFLCNVASAQSLDEELDRHAGRIYQQVFSPFCPGRSLNDCPSSKAQELKREMRQKLERGVPPEVVLEQVFQQYGDQYRAVPQNVGFGRLVWLAPALFLAFGAILAFVIARGRRTKVVIGANARPPEPPEAAAQSVSPELRARIEAELAHFD